MLSSAWELNNIISQKWIQYTRTVFVHMAMKQNEINLLRGHMFLQDSIYYDGHFVKPVSWRLRVSKFEVINIKAKPGKVKW